MTNRLREELGQDLVRRITVPLNRSGVDNPIIMNHLASSLPTKNRIEAAERFAFLAEKYAETIAKNIKNAYEVAI